MLAVPMLREDVPLGVLALMRSEGTSIHGQANRAGIDLRRSSGDSH